MKRALLITCFALAASTAFAVPAMAQGGLTCETTLFGEYDSAAVLTQLKEKGVDATSVGEWGGDTIIAAVQQPDGHTGFRYFKVDTLEEVMVPAGAPVGQRQPSSGNAAPAAADSTSCPPSLTMPTADDVVTKSSN